MFSNETLEYSVLAYLIANPKVGIEVYDNLYEDLFTIKETKEIFNAINKKLSLGRTYDLISIANSVKSINLLQEFENIAQNLQDTFSIQESLIQLSDLDLQRKWKHLGETVVNLVDKNGSPSSIQTEVEKFTEFRRVKRDGICYDEALFSRRQQNINERKHRVLIFTGYDSLDRHLSEGFSPGTISLIAARPSMGKTTILSNLVNKMMKTIGVLVFPIEEGFDSFIDRMQTVRNRIPLKELKQISLWVDDDPKKQQIEDDLVELSKNTIYISSDNGITLSSFKNDVRLLKARGKEPKVVFIDHFGFFKDIHIGDGSKTETIENTLSSLKEFARDEKIHICSLYHIKQPQDKKKVGPPMLSDISDSDSFAKYMDLIILLHRDSYYSYEESNTETNTDIINFIIAKQRFGIRNKFVPFITDWRYGILEEMPENS